MESLLLESEEPILVLASDEPTDSNETAVLWMKITFIILSFLEAMIAGLIPTWSSSCRESPKILGIANSFAGGVFLAIAFMHITPEMIETWNDLDINSTELPDGTRVYNEKIFPLPELLIFCGYTFILIIDKVLFDTHALFDHDEGGHHHDHGDPADAAFAVTVRRSTVKSSAVAETGDPAKIRASMAEQQEDMEGAMKSYLNPHDRFAQRMRASMKRSQADASGDGQQQIFVDSGNVDLEKNGEESKYHYF